MIGKGIDWGRSWEWLSIRDSQPDCPAEPQVMICRRSRAAKHSTPWGKAEPVHPGTEAIENMMLIKRVQLFNVLPEHCTMSHRVRSESLSSALLLENQAHVVL